MWAEGEIEALSIGVDLEFYWGEKMTPLIYQKYVNAYSMRMNREREAVDASNHLLGLYVRRAVADVLSGKNKYPERPFLAKKQTTLERVYSKEETEAFIASLGKGNPDDSES